MTALAGLALCLLLFGGLPSLAAAYTGPAVDAAMLKQMGKADTLTVRQRVETIVSTAERRPAPEQDGAGVSLDANATLLALPVPAPAADPPAEIPPVLTENLIYQLAGGPSPGGFRAEIRSEAIERLYLEVGGEALLVVDGRLDPQGVSWFDTFKDLLFFTRRLALHRHLAIKGVDLAVTSLGLWEGRPVHVLGARFPDAAPAQIWVDKETLLPLRWLWTKAAESDAAGPDSGSMRPGQYEIRYDRWQLFGKRHYPLRVQFFEDHQPVRTLFAESVSVDQAVDAALLDLEAVRQTALPAEVETPLTEEGRDPAVDEIQEAIDIFKQRYE